MKLSILFCLLIVGALQLESSAYSQVKWAWLKDIGSQHIDETVYSTEIDTKGNIIMLTRTLDSAVVVDKYKEIKLMIIKKYHPDGNLLWEKKLSGIILPGGLCVDSSDNIYVNINTFDTLLFFESTALHSPEKESHILKLSSDGSLLWTKQISQQRSFGWAPEDNTKLIAIDRDNNLILTGRAHTTDSTFKIDGVSYFKVPKYGSIFLTKFDSIGKVLWARLIDESADIKYFSEGTYVAIDNENNIMLLGYFTGTFKNVELELACKGGMDMFLGKFSTDGSLIWINGIGSESRQSGAAEWGWGLALDELNNSYITGSVYGDVYISRWTGVSAGSSNAEMFVGKFDPNGLVVWNKRIAGLNAKRLGTAVSDCPMGIDYSSKDKRVVCRSHLFGNAKIDSVSLMIPNQSGSPVLWSYTPEGKLDWVFPMDSVNGYFQFNSLSIDRNSNMYLSGYVGGRYSQQYPETIGPYTFLTAGGNDGIFAKLSLTGNTSVSGNKSNQLASKVYPNPFIERTVIELPESKNITGASISIYNILGAKVLTLPVDVSNNSYTLERNGLSAGVYHYIIGNNEVTLRQGDIIIL